MTTSTPELTPEDQVLSEENGMVIDLVAPMGMRDGDDWIISTSELNRLLNAARDEGRRAPGQGWRPTGRVIELKTWPEPFAAVRARLKPWELRFNDRDYQVGDLLRLREWCPPAINAHDLSGEADGYTGEVEDRRVTWMLEGGNFGLPKGYVIMSLSPPNQGEEVDRP